MTLLLCVSCGPQLTVVKKTVYSKTQKTDKKVTLSYILPDIKTAANTKQSQTKGGITITTEIVPFSVDRRVDSKEEYTYSDNNKPHMDVIEVTNTPYYVVSPDKIQFKIRIRNEEKVPLKLSEVGFAIIIDGLQWSFPEGYLDSWSKGIILSGFEKEYIVNGPQLNGLNNAKVVYIFINGVPTSYNEAGNVLKKSNFEWYFECKESQNITKEDIKTYSYKFTPVHNEQCSKCKGTGQDPKPYQCNSCKGTGSFVANDGKRYECNTCKGTGKVYNSCDNCFGGGIVYYPKSDSPKIEKMVTLTSWNVNVVTNPIGAKVKVADEDDKYYDVVDSNNNIVFYFVNAQSRETGFKPKSYCEPIIIEYKGQEVKVIPCDKDWKKLNEVIVDFTGSTPIIVKGRGVE